MTVTPDRDRWTALSREIRVHEAYWAERLARLEGPAIPYRRATRTGQVGHSSVAIPLPEGLDPDRVVAAFAAYLARLCDTPGYHLAYGTDALRRAIAGFETRLAARVPVEVQIDPRAETASQLAAVREAFASAAGHLTYGLDDSRAADGARLPVVAERLASWHALTWPLHGELTLLVTDSPGECRLAYDTECYAVESILALRSQLSTFLHAVHSEPGRPLCDQPLLDEDERRRILLEWNATEAPCPDAVCMHQLFERTASRVPDKVALVFERDEITYRELNERANRLAHFLRACGVRPDTLVGLCLERSPSLLVALLGIAKAGGAYVALDPDLPSERLGTMLDDCGAPLLITQEALLPRLPPHEARVVCLDRDGLEIARSSAEDPEPAAGPRDLAYVLYTSGSTGRPKGVMIENRSLVNFLGAMAREPGIDEDDVLLSVTTISFDIAALELYLPLIRGARVVLASAGAARDGARLAELLRASGATLMQATPATWQLLLTSSWEDRRLRMLCGGEALSRKLAARLLARGGRLWNLYGPTEATVWVSAEEVRCCDRDPTIGRPIANTRFYILDSQRKPVPVGVPGLLYVGGVQLARGYLKRPELDAERFVPDPFGGEPGARLYDTGDRARYLPDGRVECLGRNDHQIKMRGFRIELGEIESTLASHPQVDHCAVVQRQDPGGQARLLAYVVPAKGAQPGAGSLRRFLAERLPEYMIPAVFTSLEALPLTPNGKIDRRSLPAPDTLRPELETRYAMPEGEVEDRIASIWREALQIDEVGVLDNFFDLGGHSLLLASVGTRLGECFGREIPMVELLRYPTVRALARHLTAPASRASGELAPRRRRPWADRRDTAVAVIGLACRFPGAASVGAFWENLTRGVESVTFFDDEELLASGVPASLLAQPTYVKAGCVLPDIEGFDAEFFGYSVREAETMDPQQRLFLENAWEALEDAGYAPGTFRGPVGVYAGAGMNSYLLANLAPSLLELTPLERFQLMVGNDKDYLPTRVSYKLDLRGPSLSIQTACSTSLVAIHAACQGLLAGECDLALAGGVAVAVPQRAGYLFQDGMISSPDGHCRSFDARAGGTIFGSGAGAVVLKRLDEAIADRDCIYAVVKGSAVNNDGSLKPGYTAPSVEGQAEVISMAQEAAGVAAETIRYVEAHGTATPLGDPIEVAALTQAFRRHTRQKGFCGIGSVKTNIGHLDAAAGVAGFIKAVLALKHEVLPPTLHFEEPNPRIDLGNSPFYVVSESTAWRRAPDDPPRRAGVSSFGIGGTNCHVVLEEAPEEPPAVTGMERPRHLLTLSARSESALTELAARYEAHLSTRNAAPLPDVCFTANAGRAHFGHRLAVVAGSGAELRERLAAARSGDEAEGVISGRAGRRGPKIAFLFTGQGAQYCGMGRELYETQPTFRRELDRCAEILRPHLETPLLDVLYPGPGASSPLDQTAYTQPALFALEYSLARLWASWGIEPAAVLGHSVGEYVAACVAGVFDLEQGLRLIAERGRLMQALPRDAEMFAVAADECRVAQEIGPDRDHVSLASINGPEHVVISGRTSAVRGVVARLEAQGLKVQKLKVSHAFHSPSMDPMLEPFGEFVKGMELSPPALPLISNLDGKSAAREVTTPGYWCRHVREPVRFADGVASLAKLGCEVFLEMGPKPTLLGMARLCQPAGVVAWLPSLREGCSEWQQLLESLGELYVRGTSVDWSGFDAEYPRRRVPLPTYPFQRKRCWIDAGPAPARQSPRPARAPGASPGSRDVRPPPSRANALAGKDLLGRLRAAPPGERAALLTRYVQAEVARALRLDRRGADVDPQQRLSEMGMDSLLSVELRSRLAKSLGVSLPPTFAFDSSVARVSELLLDLIRGEEGSSRDWSCVLPLQPGGSQRPFFFLSGSRNHFGSLLGPDQPVYRVLYQDLSGERPFVRIEEMAAFSIAGMRRIQPEGPYDLGGHGVGGVVAFEIAQQLQRQGQAVGALVLCETWAPGSTPAIPRSSLLRRLRQRGMHYLHRSRRVGSRRQLAELLRDLMRNTRRALARAHGAERAGRADSYRSAASEAVEHYAPQCYPGRITVFRCMDHPPWGYEDPLNGWGSLAGGGAESYEIPGSHTGMYREPHALVLARTLQDVLRKARADRNPA